ncbi:MAG TPA: TasA family protein [Oryzihumus sp.]|nr:TasA family protein [Oryzihumus sp.]
MRLSLNSTGGKVLASTVVLGAAATIAGLGTFGSFTSTTGASESAGTGTVVIGLAGSGTDNRLSVAATGLVPGDTVQRVVKLNNTGSQNLASVTLTTAATTTSVLDTDATNGLQLKLDSCSVPWTEAGTSPAYTYTCSGTTTSVLASHAVIGSAMALSNLSSLTAGASDNLKVTLSFPSAADNTFQNKSSVIGFTFDALQRTATDR